MTQPFPHFVLIAIILVGLVLLIPACWVYGNSALQERRERTAFYVMQGTVVILISLLFLIK